MKIHDTVVPITGAHLGQAAAEDALYCRRGKMGAFGPSQASAMLELNQIHHMNCLDGLRQLETDSVDICVT
jgi:hypothetical protein